MRSLICALALAVVAGSASGFLWSPTQGEAVVRYAQYIFTPESGIDSNHDGAIMAHYSCGWHPSGCGSGGWGQALDLDRTGAEGGSDAVTFRGWGTHQGVSQSIYQTAYMEIHAAPPGSESCTVGYVDIYNSDTYQFVLRLRYVHVASDTYWAPLYSAKTYHNLNAHHEGNMVQTEPSCPWEGQNVHSTHSTVGIGDLEMRENTCSQYNYYVCQLDTPLPPGTTRNKNALDYGSWHRYVQWTW